MISVLDYRTRADNGDEDALLIVGLLAALGITQDDDLDVLEAALRDAADMGSSYAQYVLGRALEPKFRAADSGDYLSAERTDLDRAISAYRVVAERNFLPAQEKLGILYEALGNLDVAIKWYERAVDGESVNAAMNLVRIYDEDTGLRPNAMRARLFYEKAEELGHLPAVAAAGEKLMTSSDPKAQAEGWEKLRKAVVKGNAWAYLHFSSIIMKGLFNLSDKKVIAKIFADMAKQKLKET